MDIEELILKIKECMPDCWQRQYVIDLINEKQRIKQQKGGLIQVEMSAERWDLFQKQFPIQIKK